MVDNIVVHIAGGFTFPGPDSPPGEQAKTIVSATCYGDEDGKRSQIGPAIVGDDLPSLFDTLHGWCLQENVTTLPELATVLEGISRG